MYLFVVNRTFVHENGLTTPFAGLMILVTVLTAIGMLMVVVGLVVRVFSTHYGMHVNTMLLLENFALVYLFLCPAIFIVYLQVLDWSNKDSLEDNAAFHVANMMRAFYLGVGCFSLPALAVERSLATTFVADYETRPRKHISFLLIAAVDLTAALFTVAFIYDWCSPVVLLVIIGAVNGLGVVVFCFFFRRNIHFYEDNLINLGRRGYSLSQRFQVVENIKVSRMMKKIFFSSSIFNFVLVIAYSVNMLSRSELVSNGICLVFDLVVSLYPIVTPAISYSTNPVFKREFKLLAAKYCVFSKSGNSRIEAVKPAEVRTVFGVQVIQDPEEGTRTYFQNLSHLWNT